VEKNGVRRKDMRILDASGKELTSPDLRLGRLKEDRILVARHPAVEPVEETWHYEVVAQYPNGGRDVEKVVDTPGVEGKEAWDEYEDIHRYIPYTQSELEKIKADEEAARKNAPVPRAEMEALEAKLEAVLRYQGLTVREAAPGVYEVIKDVPQTGGYLDPIAWQPGDAVTAGLWYYTENKELPHEAIQSGVPESFRDPVYFDFVEGT